MRIAIVPAVYNRPDMLAALFEAYLVQDYGNFEIVVADDGSGEETRELIKKYQQKAKFRIVHARQENTGPRVGAIRNRAVALTDADYIIFTDQDCIPRPDFVSTHARLAERGWFVAGSRVLLSEKFTKIILEKSILVHDWSLFRWFAGRARKDINRFHPLLKIAAGSLRKLHPMRWRGANTCNLGVWRDDYVRVNGMDEAFTGWGMDDSDLVVRLLRAGVKHKTGRYAVPVFHLWHPIRDRSKLVENQRRLQEVINGTHIRAHQGIDQYL